MEATQLTPSQAKFYQQHRERQERIAAKAVAQLARDEIKAEAKVEESAPQDPIAAWVERQKQIPLPKTKYWFSVEEDLGPVVAQPTISLEDILQAIARRFNVRRNEILSVRRLAKLVRARQIAMYLGKLFTARSYPDIARRLGSRDHTTILYGAKKIARLREIDTGLEMDLRMIAASLGASLDR